MPLKLFKGEKYVLGGKGQEGWYESGKKTRTEVRENIIGLSLLKLLFIVVSPTKLSDNVFNLSIKEFI